MVYCLVASTGNLLQHEAQLSLLASAGLRKLCLSMCAWVSIGGFVCDG